MFSFKTFLQWCAVLFQSAAMAALTVVADLLGAVDVSIGTDSPIIGLVLAALVPLVLKGVNRTMGRIPS